VDEQENTIHLETIIEDRIEVNVIVNMGRQALKYFHMTKITPRTISHPNGSSYTFNYKIELPVWKFGGAKSFKEEFLVSVDEPSGTQGQYQAILGKNSTIRKVILDEEADQGNRIDAAPTEIAKPQNKEGTFISSSLFFFSFPATLANDNHFFIDRKKRDKTEKDSESLARIVAARNDAQRQETQKRRRGPAEQKAKIIPLC
jgi:hypothetical protein